MAESKVKKTTASLRATAKQSQSLGKPQNKIATSSSTKVGTPRNDNLLSVPVYSLVGKETGSLDLPKEIFGVEVNTALLAQALRVYQNNQKAHWGSTKTRGEMSYSTKKIYKQKGTGGARHGSKSAPIFVHTGGVALGPKHRKVELELPQKMRTKALVSALSQKAKDKSAFGLSGLEKANGKTKEIALLMKVLEKKSALIVVGERNDLAVRAIRNLQGINVLPANLLNAYEVIKHQSLVLTQEAVEKLQERLK